MHLDLPPKTLFATSLDLHILSKKHGVKYKKKKNPKPDKFSMRQLVLQDVGKRNQTYIKFFILRTLISPSLFPE